jgi:hypothetical protein
MHRSYELLECRPWLLVYEEGAGEGEGEGAGEGEGSEGGKGGTATFTQEDVNKMLAKDKRKGREQLQKALDEIKTLQKRTDLNKQEREELEGRVTAMNNELLTKDELAQQERDKAKSDYEASINEVTEERDSWKGRYTDSTITREIMDAAISNNAFSPKQLVPILRPLTRLTEGTDDEGHPNGQYEVKVEYPDTDKKGKPVTLSLSPAEAIKRMAETDDYLNLFKDAGTGGVGGNTRQRSNNSGEIDMVELAKDPEKYRKWRAENG